jgi:hypothetical protein
MEAGGFFSHYGDFFGHPVGQHRSRACARSATSGRTPSGSSAKTCTGRRPSTAPRPRRPRPGWAVPSTGSTCSSAGSGISESLPSRAPPTTLLTLTASPSPPSTASGNHDADQGERRAVGRASRTLGGVRSPRMERAWPPNPRGYTLASPSPDRTGGQITDRQPGADTDRTPGESASPDPRPIPLNPEPIQRSQRRTNRTA